MRAISEPLTLTVVGSASPYPSPDNPYSGYLITTSDTRVWMDAGTGTLAELRRHTFAIHELHDGHCAQLGSLTLTTRAVTHGMPAFALRIDTAGGSLVYSGDTAPCASLTTLAENCDALQAATSANARQLIITHVGPFLTPEQALIRASRNFSGPIDYAAPGKLFSIG
jgi:ribonuclease BN (tRNA processing enzyme)